MLVDVQYLCTLLTNISCHMQKDIYLCKHMKISRLEKTVEFVAEIMAVDKKIKYNKFNLV